LGRISEAKKELLSSLFLWRKSKLAKYYPKKFSRLDIAGSSKLPKQNRIKHQKNCREYLTTLER
jgi:hypothetical protein